MKFYWTKETIEYFKNKSEKEVSDFVKQNCTLEDGETYEMLAKDLIKQTK